MNPMRERLMLPHILQAGFVRTASQASEYGGVFHTLRSGSALQADKKVVGKHQASSCGIW